MRKKCVVDASVILKFLLNESSNVASKFEDLLEKARDGEVEILSHSLIVIEVANGLRFTLKDKALANETLKVFQQLPFKVLPLTKAQQEKTLNLSYELGTTTYDTSYHVLAKTHGAVFLTSDKDYFKKAKRLKGIDYWE